MNRRAFVIAFVIAAVCVVLMEWNFKRYEREASGGSKIRLLIAVKPMERGKPITEDQLATHEIPTAYLEPRAIKDTERSKIVGLRIGTTVQPGQGLLWTDLATANEERRDLASLILPGHRGVSVSTGRKDSSAGMVKPGDYVDVLLTVLENANGTIGGFGTENHSTLVILQRVLVIATGYDTSPVPADNDKPQDMFAKAGTVLTLSVSLEDAQKLTVAQDKGSISVTLRNPDDNGIASNQPRISSLSFNQDKAAPLPVATAPVGPAIVPQNPR
jgi:pilus assembly protein CpaB